MAHISPSQGADLEVHKDIPGYKAILKTVLKSQIQHLVEQLSKETGEESLLLTASVTDGTLSHLGSNCGKFFLEDHEEFKSKFLGYCLQRKLPVKRKTEEIVKSADDTVVSTKRQRAYDDGVSPSPHLHPVVLIKVSSASTKSAITTAASHSNESSDVSSESSFTIKHKKSEKDKGITPGNMNRDYEVERDSESEEFGESVDNDREDLAVNPDKGNADIDPCIIIKQEPIDMDETAFDLEANPDSERSLYTYTGKREPWGLDKYDSKLQTFGKTSKEAVSCLATEQFAEAGPSSLNPVGNEGGNEGEVDFEMLPEAVPRPVWKPIPLRSLHGRPTYICVDIKTTDITMLSDYYLREVLSQITTKTTQLTEIGLDAGLPGVVPPGDKPYRCHLCGRGFTQRGNLEVHMWTQHGNK